MAMKHCYVIAQALSVTHARISLPHALNHERSYGRNAENSRTKMADYRIWGMERLMRQYSTKYVQPIAAIY